MDADKPLAIYEICARLGLGRSSVYSLLRSGRIPSRRIGVTGKRYLVTQADVETYILSRYPDETARNSESRCCNKKHVVKEVFRGL